MNHSSLFYGSAKEWPDPLKILPDHRSIFSECVQEVRVVRQFQVQNNELTIREQNIQPVTSVRVLTPDSTFFTHLPAVEPATIQSVWREIASRSGEKLVDYQESEFTDQTFHDGHDLDQFSDLEKIEVIRRAADAASRGHRSIDHVTAQYDEDIRHIQFINSDGQIRQTTLGYFQLQVRSTARKKGFQGDGVAVRGGRHLDAVFNELPEKTGIESARDAVELLNAKSLQPGFYPVLFGHGWPALWIHEALGHALEADIYFNPQSFLHGKLNQKIAPDSLSVMDDGRFNAGRAYSLWDDEGIDTTPVSLIQNGELVGLLSDRQSAHRYQIPQTGNGRRVSAAHTVLPRMRHLTIEKGAHDSEAMLSEMKSGIWIGGFENGETDPISGQFEFNAHEAWLIQNGRSVHRVKGATLGGSVLSALSNIVAIGNDKYIESQRGFCTKDGQELPVSVGQPSILFSKFEIR